jgi:hypothetical protein
MDTARVLFARFAWRVDILREKMGTQDGAVAGLVQRRGLRFARRSFVVHQESPGPGKVVRRQRRTRVKTRPTAPSRMVWLLTLAAILIPVSAALAQENHIPTAAVGGMLSLFFILFVVLYVYLALAIQTIATKTNTENPWLAWIPIANLFLLLNIAKKPLWWLILLFIPLVSIVVAILVWMGVAEARGKPNWWGILLIVPLVGLIVPGYLAWSD